MFGRVLLASILFLVSLIPTCNRPTPVAVALSWNDSETGVGFYVYRNGVRLTPSPIAVKSYEDTTAVHGNIYTYYVTAFDGTSESSPSNSVVVPF